MKDNSTIVFTGDIGFDHYMSGRWADENLLSAEIKEFLKDSDHVAVNVEGALYDGERKGRDNSVAALLHSMPCRVGSFLKETGADIWNICNNHIMDAGAEGLFDTLRVASECGAYTVGAGLNIIEASKPLILDEAGGIGMFGVGYQRACRKADENTPGCFSWSDLPRIKETIEEIKKTCRWCIVIAHAGEEFTSLPTPYTRDRYLEYLNLGADIVIAHHPHVPMNYETVGEKTIFYSLGNFIFDTDYQRSQPNTEKGIVVKLKFSQGSYEWEAVGINTDRINERIEKDSLPAIFTDVSEDEYRLLVPLSAKAFIAATKRQQIYLKPDKYSASTSDKEWEENFNEPLRSGRVPGETLDFAIILPLAESEGKKEWKKSRLEDVKKYILEQM